VYYISQTNNQGKACVGLTANISDQPTNRLCCQCFQILHDMILMPDSRYVELKVLSSVLSYVTKHSKLTEIAG